MGFDAGTTEHLRSDTVSIVIPVFGPEHFLTACLNALKVNSSDFELLLIDNATGYDMRADCVVRNPTNMNFAYACNQGAALANSDIVVFLNVDTEPQFDWLISLMAAFDDPEVVMAGPKIIHPNGSLQTSGVRTWHGNGSAGGEELKDDSPSRDVDGVTGACMAIRRNAFHELGGFDTDFINGYEDVALCLSAREKAYRIRYVAESVIVHHESATGPERWTHAHQNVATMNAKWGAR